MELQSLAASAGAARITVFTINGFALHRSADSSAGAGARAQGARARAGDGQPASRRVDRHAPARRAHGRAHVFVSNGGVDGVVLVQAPLRDVQEQVSAVERRLVFGGSLAFGVALLAGLLAAEPLARRLARLQAAAERIARGSFGEPIVDHKARRDRRTGALAGRDAQRLDALERARSAFIANASHELRTPLTALGGYLELLTEGGLTEAERDEFLETMGEQVQRLTKLATDLLDLSRLDAGGFTVAHDELELGELASDAAREMQALAARRGSAVVAEPGAAALARGDEGRVLQVLRVLVDNAVRHTPPGSTVTLRTETTPWGASIVVSDNGPGIPPELLERVFERFFRGPGAAARGTGLGLAIARELAERMDGRLLATSSPAGTRFTLELPGPVRRGHARLHWESVTTRAALASAVIIALVAGIAGGALALALRDGGGDRTTVTDRRPRRRRRQRGGFDPVALYAGSRNGVVTIEATLRRRRRDGGSGFVVNARRGLIVTASHVVARANAGSPSATRGDGRLHRARRRHARRRARARLRPLRGHGAAAGGPGEPRAARAAARARPLAARGRSGRRDRQPVREPRVALDGRRLPARPPDHRARRVLPDDRRRADRRRRQSGQLGRPAAECRAARSSAW